MKIKIEKLINEGFGLGHDKNGKSIFVRKSVPGDILDVETTKDKKNFSEAIIKEIIEPSPHRIKPICPNFDFCGGCESMNISYPDQLKYKEEIFAETLQRQGIETKIESIIPGSSEQHFYRNSIRFSFISNNDDIAFARHNFIYSKGLVEVDKCYLQSETSNEIITKLKEYINDNVSDKSLFWQLKIREGKFTNQFMIEIITSGEHLPEEKGIVDVLKNISGVKSIYHTIAPNKSLKNLKRRLIFGSPIIFEKIGRYTFQISPESFFQTNSLGAHTLYDVIKKYADIKIGDNILDLYCGTGSIGIYLSTLAKKVVGVEIVPEAIRDAKDNARINKIHNCEFICSDVEKYLCSLKTKNRRSRPELVEGSELSTIIIDPPRAGLSKELIKNILNFKLQNFKLIYVSCNPATFARDVKIFQEFGKKLVKVQPIDMFPQTHHIECVGIIK